MNVNFSNFSYLSDASLLMNLDESKLLENEEPSVLQGLFFGCYAFIKETQGEQFLLQDRLEYV